MSASASAPGIHTPAAPAWIPPAAATKTREARWSLAFLGILGYLVVEYTRLAAMYPVLVPLQLGKVTVAVALVGMLLSPGRKISLPRTVRTIDLAIVFFLFTSLLSASMADFQDPAWEYFGYIVRWAIVYVLISRSVNSAWRLRVFIFLFLLLNLKLAQFVLRSYGHATAAGVDEMMLMVRGVGAGSTGFFSNSADFGVAMCVAWPIAVALLFSRPKALWKLLLPVCSIVFLGAILVCGSRAAVVGAAAVAVVAWVRSSRKLMAALLVVLLVLGLVSFYPEASKERMRSAWNWEQDKTASNRVYLWKHGLRMLAADPLFGVGPGNFPFKRGSENLSASVPHSIYIESLSEYGLAGTLSVALAVLGFFILNAHTRRQLEARGGDVMRQFEYCMAYGLDLAMIGYLTSGAFAAVLLYPHLWILAALAVGLSAASQAPVDSPTSSRVRHPAYSAVRA